MQPDPDRSGSQPGPEPGGEIADRSDAAPSDAKSERIVELCSAADAVEAHALCDLLEEAGIHARMVGESLGYAGGGLPLGEAIAPRVWVSEKDAARAREIVDDWRDRPCENLGTSAEGEAAADSDSDEEEGPAGTRCPRLSRGGTYGRGAGRHRAGHDVGLACAGDDPPVPGHGRRPDRGLPGAVFVAPRAAVGDPVCSRIQQLV